MSVFVDHATDAPDLAGNAVDARFDFAGFGFVHEKVLLTPLGYDERTTNRVARSTRVKSKRSGTRAGVSCRFNFDESVAADSLFDSGVVGDVRHDDAGNGLGVPDDRARGCGFACVSGRHADGKR